MISILYWVAPNAKRQRGFRLFSPGGVIAVVVWLIASALFAFYVANFSHYNKTYGSIAGVIILLIWLWISNLAILFGAEFNAELERGRAAGTGVSRSGRSRTSSSATRASSSSTASGQRGPAPASRRERGNGPAWWAGWRMPRRPASRRAGPAAARADGQLRRLS
jgi:membrane protein